MPVLDLIKDLDKTCLTRPCLPASGGPRILPGRLIFGAVSLDSYVGGAAGLTAIASILPWNFGSVEGRVRCLLGDPGSLGVA